MKRDIVLRFTFLYLGLRHIQPQMSCVLLYAVGMEHLGWNKKDLDDDIRRVKERKEIDLILSVFSKEKK